MDLRNPNTQKIMILIILLAGAIYLFYSHVYTPRMQQIQQLQIEYNRSNSLLLKTKQTIATLPQLQKQIENLEQRWAYLQELLPTKKEVPSLLRMITIAGEKSGIEFIFFKPLPIRTHEFYIENPYQIKVVGGYHQLGQFISHIGNLSRIVYVSGLTVTAYKDEDRPEHTVQAEFIGTAYVLPDEYYSTITTSGANK